MPLKVCIATGGRADYGLLKKLIFLIKKDSHFKLQTVVTGSHLYKKYGYTINEIINDQIKIDKKIFLKISSDTPTKICEAVSIGVRKFSLALNELKPDLLIVLGDRYEIFSLVVSAHIMGIPIAHLHGGETTEAAIDEAFRHSITKMSDIHFVANKIYEKRVIQLGENKKNVFLVGGLGVDQIDNKKLYSQKEVEKILKIKFKRKNILITYHPETIKNKKSANDITPVLKSLKKLKDTNLIFTIPNSDTHNLLIYKKIYAFVKDNKNSFLYKSLGHKLYLSTIRFVDCVIGNSSSGLSEVPIFKKPTINIGDRQKGRVKVKSIIDVKNNSKIISNAIRKIDDPKFINSIKDVISPYGKGGAGKKIIKILKTVNTKNIKLKKFFDLNF